ncbi:Glutathione hydrolase proenzyme [BD1-7 clade bacterium]|uniref:Glutathione hydrolase proenzyme n=1 Tax=BD1-7 clade bacterium TaxID=2029982 RepID=A0A5S9N467_9GAMM|nr:Glutathione hydrolase proenzyme [BD1-7 clade bacterium]CAA0083829.1 Glutathione hydrolase proenzyme [BD1-7 clade bacterium]
MGKIRHSHRQSDSLITRHLRLLRLPASLSTRRGLARYLTKPISYCLMGACLTGPVAATEIHPEGASGRQSLKSAQSSEWMVVTATPYASDAAAQMITLGGSAVDAAIAAQLVLGITEPQSSGIGGGGFMVHWQADGKKLTTYDGRETAPKSINADYFMVDKQPMGFFEAVVGGYSVGVPGLVAMLNQAHQAHGKLPWATLFDPAIELAEQGFPISPRLHTLLEYMARSPKGPSHDAIRSYFYQANGQPKAIGTLLKNPAYANTLKQIAKQGPSVFYRGAIAEQIVNAVRNDPVKKGSLSMSDMANYKSIERQPVCRIIQANNVCGMPPPSSGPISVIQMLSMLDMLPGYQGLGYESPGFYHRLIETSKLAFADRNRYIADPAFVDQPQVQLLDTNYLKSRADQVPLLKASKGAVAAGDIGGFAYQPSQSPELPSTTHLSIVDADGNVVSMTTSIETAFGSRVMVGGFLLNNQLTDFSFVPTDANGKVANRPEGGKRPRSSMSPMIVFDEQENPILVVGSPGGSRIINYVAKTIAQQVFLKAPLEQAIASPNLTNINKGTSELEQDTDRTQSLASALRAIGHTIKTGPQPSGIQAISIKNSRYHGVADPRREGTAVGSMHAAYGRAGEPPAVSAAQ